MKTIFIFFAALIFAAQTVFAETVTVHTYTASPNGFLVNSHLIETKRGVIVIDAQFLVSEAKKVKEMIRGMNKPILGIIITHPHPDHYNGIGVIVEGERNVRVYATKATYNGIVASEKQKRAQWKPTYKEDYPDKTVFPNKIIKSGRTITIDGVSLKLEDIGEGEASNITVVSLPSEKSLFTGDLVYTNMHSWLAEGRSSAWIGQLGYVLKKYSDVRTIYPGHGEKGTLMLVNRQIEYVNTFQTLVREQLEKSGAIGEGEKKAIKEEMEKRYPNYPLALLLDWNIEAVAKEIAKK